MKTLPVELQGARMALLTRRPYLGHLLLSLVPVERTTEDNPTLAVDPWFRLYYNTTFLADQTAEERVALLYHEVSHLLREHHGRLHELDESPTLLNVAGDMEINDDIREETYRGLQAGEDGKKFTLPKGVVYPEAPLFKFPANETAEQYVERLQRWRKDNPDKCLPDPRCGSGAPGTPQPGEEGPPNGQNADGVGKSEQHVIRQATAEAIRKEAAKGQGRVPASLERWAEEFLKPKVDWRRELRAAVRAAIGSTLGANDYTFRRPHRRSSYLGVVLPTLQRPIPKVAVAVDTSGSMGDQQLSQARSEIEGVLRTLGTPVQVLSVDCEVHGAAQRVQSAKKVKLTGGGGTDMSLAMRALGDLKPTPDIGVVLTDGITGWPEEPITGMKSVVVILGTQEKGPEWARVIHVEKL